MHRNLKRMKISMIFCAAVALSGCQTPPVKVESVPACPPSFLSWDKKFQTTLADALRLLPRDAAGDSIRRAIREGVSVRGELRAAGCQEKPAR